MSKIVMLLLGLAFIVGMLYGQQDTMVCPTVIPGVEECSRNFLDHLDKLAMPVQGIQKLSTDTSYGKIYCNYGSLFREGHKGAIATFLVPEPGCGYKVFGFAYYSQIGPGIWETRYCQKFDYEGSAAGAFWLQNLHGDEVPELLLVEAAGATGNVSVSIYEWQPNSDTLIQIADNIDSPCWDGEHLITYRRGGCAGAENYYSAFQWQADHQLIRVWDYSQYPEFDPEFDSAVMHVYYTGYSHGVKICETEAWGNLCSPPNLYDGCFPEQIQIKVFFENEQKLRDIQVTMDKGKLQSYQIDKDFISQLARSIFENSGFCGDTMLHLANAYVLQVKDVAKVHIIEQTVENIREGK